MRVRNDPYTYIRTGRVKELYNIKPYITNTLELAAKYKGPLLPDDYRGPEEDFILKKPKSTKNRNTTRIQSLRHMPTATEASSLTQATFPEGY